jgi:starch synthase
VKVLAVASEVYPLMKTGGLADVTAALPRALQGQGVAVTTLMPGYPAVMAALQDGVEVYASDDLFGGPARVLGGRAEGLDLFVVDAPHLYDRPGNPYMGPDGQDWPDNAFRFGALAWIASRFGLGEVAAYRPDIIHGHDWQSALTMAYLHYDGRPRARTLITVHNLAFQGQFPADLLEALRLPARAYAIEGVEFYGTIGFLKAGLQFADRITTVSPTYATEIQTPENGCGVDALLRARTGVLHGILNGIDVDVWNPATDLRIASRYDAASIDGRAANKNALQRRFGLAADPARLLFATVTRFTWQKGIDLLLDAVPTLVEAGAQLAMLGTGDQDLERRCRALAENHPGSVACVVGYDEDLAHLIQAGSDALLVPSRFEPCGLTQLCALRYGSLPVVAGVGGLADTVADIGDPAGEGGATGVRFNPVTVDALQRALRRTAEFWRQPAMWARVQANGMATDVSWHASARRYARLYDELIVTPA